MKSEDIGIPERQLQERVGQACDVCVSNVFRIIKEDSACTGDIKSFSTLHKKRSTKEIRMYNNNFM